MTHTEPVIRGQILSVLSVRNGVGSVMGLVLLMKALDLVGISLSARELSKRCVYLEGKGYLTLFRRKNLSSWDRGEIGAGRPDDVLSVKMTAAGQDIVDGTTSDPGVER